MSYFSGNVAEGEERFSSNRRSDRKMRRRRRHKSSNSDEGGGGKLLRKEELVYGSNSSGGLCYRQDTMRGGLCLISDGLRTSSGVLSLVAEDSTVVEGYADMEDVQDVEEGCETQLSEADEAGLEDDEDEDEDLSDDCNEQMQEKYSQEVAKNQVGIYTI